MSSNISSNSCSKFFTITENRDGGIPIILAFNIAFAAIAFSIFAVCFFRCKEFAMAAVKHNKRWPPLLSNNRNVQVNEDDEEEEGEGEGGSRRRRGSSFQIGRDYCESFMKFVLMSERDVRRRSGPDGSLYLTMELYMLVLMVIFTVLSIGVILPINYTVGNLQQNFSFARTTISNLEGSNPVLWVHVIFSWIYVMIVLVFMIHYYTRLGKVQREESLNTIMIYGIPNFVHIEDLMQHFEEIFPDIQVVDIRFAYDVKKLTKKWKQLKEASDNLQMAEEYEEKMDRPLMIRVSLCDSRRVNATEHYKTQVNMLTSRVALEKSNSLVNKLPIIFVTFENSTAPKMLVDSYKICRKQPQSSLSDSISSRRWSVSLSPYSKDLIWENLSCHPIKWWLRWAAINFVLIWFLIFFTTPTVLLNSSLDLWLLVQGFTKDFTHINPGNLTVQVPQFFQSYLSSFITFILGYVLLYLVVFSAFAEYHWTKSRRDQTILRKAFTFLLLQIVILPSVGLTSFDALATIFLFNKQNLNTTFNHLNCIFLPNAGAYFICYVIIMAFVSAPLELLRIPQFFEYLYRKKNAKTPVQKKSIIEKILRYDFMLGIQYGYNVMIFTLTISFSLITPLIVPFGMVYFLVKYFVDKYNLLYGYKPTYISGRQYLHKSAMKLVIIGSVLLQFVILFYSIVREGDLQDRSIAMIVVTTLTCVMLFAVLVLGWFTYLLPKIRIKLNKEYTVFGYEDDDDENRIVEPGDYIAPVLQETSDEMNENGLDSTRVGQSYESFGRTIAGGKLQLSPGRGRTDTRLITKKKSVIEETIVEESNVDTKDKKNSDT